MSNLRTNLGRLVRRWWILVALVVLGGVGGYLHTALTPPSYTASTVVIATAEQNNGDRRDVSFAQAYGRIVTQPDVAGDAAEAAGMSVDDVRKSTQAATSPDSPMIEITGQAPTAVKSADLVNALANRLVELAGTRVPDTGVRLIVLSAAVPPTSPSSPVATVDLAVGLAAGFLLGGLLVMARSERGRGGVAAPVGEPVEPAPAAPPAAVPDARRPAEEVAEDEEPVPVEAAPGGSAATDITTVKRRRLPSPRPRPADAEDLAPHRNGQVSGTGTGH